MPSLSLVLAHGVLGFGKLPASLVSYFNGVAAHLGDRGHHVFEPQVDSIGTIEDRGKELAAKILRWQQQTSLTAQRVHIIAHSMGGLAARVGSLIRKVNDGVVTRDSALRPNHQHLPDWPVDHAGEVGWSLLTPLPILNHPLPFVPPAPHLARYDAIVAQL